MKLMPQLNVKPEREKRGGKFSVAILSATFLITAYTGGVVSGILPDKKAEKIEARMEKLEKKVDKLAAGNAIGDFNENQKTVSEQFKITEIDSDGWIHGELIAGSGEGIYYSKNDLAPFGLDNVQPGDKIEISWKSIDYVNSNWENIAAAIKIKKK